MEYLVPIAALVVSVLTFIGSQVTQARSASGKRVDSMEARLARCERDLELCNSECHRYRAENLELLQQLVRMQRREASA